MTQADPIRPSLRRKLWVGTLALTAACVLAGGAYLAWLWTPPPMPDSVDEAMALLSSSRFARLSEQERRPYMDRTWQLAADLSEDQRRELRRKFPRDDHMRREAGAEFFLNQMRDYARSDKFKRQQILDQAIGMQEMMRSRSDGGGRGGGPPRNEARRAAGERWMHDKIEQGDPQRQAYFGEFWKDLRQRRRELGLPPDPMPGR